MNFPAIDPPFIGQVGSCCALVAVVNAARYWGLSSPEPGTEEFESYINLAGCRHGSATQTKLVAKKLGLRMVRRPYEKLTLPSMLTVWNPDPKGSALHACLLIGIRNSRLIIVNYHHQSGPLVEEVLTDEVKYPGPPNNRHYSFSVVT